MTTAVIKTVSKVDLLTAIVTEVTNPCIIYADRNKDILVYRSDIIPTVAPEQPPVVSWGLVSFVPEVPVDSIKHVDDVYAGTTTITTPDVAGEYAIWCDYNGIRTDYPLIVT